MKLFLKCCNITTTYMYEYYNYLHVCIWDEVKTKNVGNVPFETSEKNDDKEEKRNRVKYLRKYCEKEN